MKRPNQQAQQSLIRLNEGKLFVSILILAAFDSPALLQAAEQLYLEAPA